MKQVIVTGATSMMGIALLKECLKQNTAVTAVIRPNSKNAGRIPESDLITIVECENSDLISLPEKVKGSGFDSFYHFSWDGTSRELRDDVMIHEENIRQSLNAVSAAHALGCAAFVGAGSQAEYGRVSDVIAPDTPTAPEYAYGIAKLAAGKLCESYCAKLGLRFAWGRIFSVYGEYDHDDTMILYVIRSLLSGEVPALTKCEQMWDYMYCADAAHAFYLLGEKGNGFYCVGSGEMRPLSEYVEAIRAKIGGKVAFGERLYAENQVMKLCADTTKLCKDTGFTVLTGFEAGVENTINWYSDRELLKKMDNQNLL
jgi:nucleoside-diphosphate-sugar epimerase